jgi:hypothetical protein
MFCVAAAANGPIVHPPDDSWVNMEQRWNDIGRGNRRTRRKICPSTNSSTTWTGLGPNLDFRGEKPATNRLSYGTAVLCFTPIYALYEFP